MNKMPEVAKMLGVEYEPEKPDFEVLLNEEWCKAEVCKEGVRVWRTHNGYYAEPLSEIDAFALFWMLTGVSSYRPLPRYTIPSDLEVDAKVWVRNHEGYDWEPYHFAGKTVEDNELWYDVWLGGVTSFSLGGNESHYEESKIGFKHCITDEDYRKRKEGPGSAASQEVSKEGE